jgi:hypothetical protein
VQNKAYANAAAAICAEPITFKVKANILTNLLAFKCKYAVAIIPVIIQICMKKYFMPRVSKERL